MDAKFNYKNSFINAVFCFFEPFRARLTSMFEKSANMTGIFFSRNNSIRVSKNAEFDANFESVEKTGEKVTEKK
jgi:hypothetical protein